MRWNNKEAEPERFREEVAERYRDLSARADTALERLGDLPRPARRSVESDVDRLEGARELMSSQVMALKRATDDQFRILRHDVERVTHEFEDAVQRLNRLTYDAEGKARPTPEPSVPEFHPDPEPHPGRGRR